MSSKLFFWSVISIFLLSILLRIYAFSGKEIFSHDETISYLSATGNQGIYHELIAEEEPPFGTWSSIEEWKSLYEKPEALDFETVQGDLARYDIHPPLYYWLLHVAVYLFGVHLWTGAGLELLIFSMTFLMVYLISRKLVNNEKGVLFTLLIWSMSPAVAQGAYEARHYGLTAFLAMLLVFLVINFIQEERRNSAVQYGSIFVVSALGMLTNYMFAVMIAASSLLLFYHFIKFRKLKYLLGLLSVGFGSLTLFLLHPGALNVLSNSSSFHENAARLINTMHGYLGFFAVNTSSRYIILLLVLALFLSLLANWFKNRDQFLNAIKDKKLGILLLFFLSVAGLIHLFYILEFTPPHAVGGVAWNMFWPFFCMIIATILFQLINVNFYVKPILISGFCLVVIYSSFFYANNNTYLLRSWSSGLEEKINKAQYIVTDQTKRGYLPAIIHKLDESQRIYVNSSEEIRNITLDRTFTLNNVMYITENNFQSIQLNEHTYTLHKLEEPVVYETYVYELKD